MLSSAFSIAVVYRLIDVQLLLQLIIIMHSIVCVPLAGGCGGGRVAFIFDRLFVVRLLCLFRIAVFVS